MAGPLFRDRVLETSTTTGTGTYTLAGAVTGYQTWAAVGNTNTGLYYAEEVDANGVPSGGWEVGLGTYTLSGTTLARTAIIASSNSNAAVSWSAGTRRIGNSIPAAILQGIYDVDRAAIIGGVLDDATNTTISCSTVTAFIESLGYAITASPSNLTITVGASAMGHVYLKSDGTLADSTTAPVAFATPAGTARSKSGDTTQRYLGSYMNDASSHILPFQMVLQGSGPLVQYRYTSSGTSAAPYRILSNGGNTSYGSVTSFASLCPANVITEAHFTYLTIGDPTQSTPTTNFSTDGSSNNAGTITLYGVTGALAMPLRLVVQASTPGIFYKVTSATNGAYIDLTGYQFTR